MRSPAGESLLGFAFATDRGPGIVGCILHETDKDDNNNHKMLLLENMYVHLGVLSIADFTSRVFASRSFH